MFVGLALSAGVFAADKELGTWKFNSAKSKASNLKSRTEVIEETSDGWTKVTRTELRTDGTRRTFCYTFQYDGKEYPVKGGTFDTVAHERIDENTITFKVKGTAPPTKRPAASPSPKTRKTRTQTDHGTGPDDATVVDAFGDSFSYNKRGEGPKKRTIWE